MAINAALNYALISFGSAHEIFVGAGVQELVDGAMVIRDLNHVGGSFDVIEHVGELHVPDANGVFGNQIELFECETLKNGLRICELLAHVAARYATFFPRGGERNGDGGKGDG